MEVNFCEYLIKIGFINKESFSNLILDYHKKYSNNNNDFLDCMALILNNFINNLSQEEKNFMSLNLVKYYLQIMNNKKIYRLKAIYNLYKGKISLIKLKYLYRWKLIVLLKTIIDNSENIYNDNFTLTNYIHQNRKIKKRNNRNNRNDFDKNKNTFLSMKINKNNKYIDKFQILFNNYGKKKKHPISSQNESSKKFDSTKENSIKRKNIKNLSELKTSLALKEQQEIKECTFSPKINQTSRAKSPLKNEENELSLINKNFSSEGSKKKFFGIFDKLNNYDIIYRNRKKMNLEKYEELLKEQNTFRPRLYNNSFTKKFTKNNKSFNERQQLFLDKKEKNSENVKKLIEQEFSKLCSFVPEINISLESPKTLGILKEFYTNQNERDIKKDKSSSPFLRLYQDSKNRNIRQNQREKDYNKYIIDMANIPCKKDNNVDYEKINQLYLNPEKKEIMKKTKMKVEDEEGYTFKPDIYINNCSKNIYSDFFERNEKFLKDKQKFIELSIKENNKLYNKDKFSKAQKKEIVKNIVKRLTSNKNK